MEVKFVDLSRQYELLRDEILQKVDEISRQGNYILGETVATFEKEAASYCQTKFALGVGNGSDALFLSMKALGIGKGDEVITAPNSFIASAWTIAATGATPIFSDIGSDLNLNPDLLEKVITPKTKAIMPVHFTGKIANMESILEIAQRYDLLVIEDSAQAIGATYNSKKAGSFGNCGCFSLHPLKVLHVHGDGGLITTNDENLYKKLSRLRNHGLENRDNCVEWGYNSRLDAIQAGIASIKMKYLDAWIGRMREIASMYNKAFENSVETPVDTNNDKQVYHRYMIKVENRDTVQKELAKKGIETKVNYPIPIHLQGIGKKIGYKSGDFPETEKTAKRILSLPLYPELTNDEVSYVIEQVSKKIAN